ncbi:MAG: glycine zipper 2TM domain-containing protein [Caulobacteraceae bacterium]|jgi:outer membrane lipoprotein SlyB
MKKIVVFAASLAVAVGGLAGSAGAVGCLSGAVAGGVAGHFVRTGPNHHRHTLAGAAVGCVAGHEMKMHEKRVAAQRRAAAAAGQPVPAHH